MKLNLKNLKLNLKKHEAYSKILKLNVKSLTLTPKNLKLNLKILKVIRKSCVSCEARTFWIKPNKI